jgi:hypothetical protein
MLAGDDLFWTTSLTRSDLVALHRDLLADRKRGQWPTLGADLTKIEDKKRWRATEARALGKFVSEQYPVGILHAFRLKHIVKM